MNYSGNLIEFNKLPKMQKYLWDTSDGDMSDRDTSDGDKSDGDKSDGDKSDCQ